MSYYSEVSFEHIGGGILRSIVRTTIRNLLTDNDRRTGIRANTEKVGIKKVGILSLCVVICARYTRRD